MNKEFRNVHIEARALRDLENSDCLSVTAHISKYSANVDGEKTIKCKITYNDKIIEGK